MTEPNERDVEVYQDVARLLGNLHGSSALHRIADYRASIESPLKAEIERLLDCDNKAFTYHNILQALIDWNDHERAVPLSMVVEQARKALAASPAEPDRWPKIQDTPEWKAAQEPDLPREEKKGAVAPCP